MTKTNRRRNFLKQAGLAIGAGLLSSCVAKPVSNLKGNINQVIAAWPFMNTGPKWSPETFIQQSQSLGVAGVELYPVEHWGLLKKHDLVCAATKSHTFIRGMNNKNHHSECFEALETAMEATSAAGFPNVMTFTGLADTSSAENGSKVSPEDGMKNCIEGYKKMARIAEQKNVSMILEPLNSKVAENMKGHPGYQGDHIEYCMEIVKAVSSPGLKLLFDVYHIQIMDGDIISHIEKYIEYIGHVQVAGVPGRGEIGKQQELNYKAVMKSLVANGYQGYVGHEWIPTGDAMTGLKEAVAICDV
ncbi:MAG: TIM barrel protein [Cyclobacteriaceae bacterium]